MITLNILTRRIEERESEDKDYENILVAQVNKLLPSASLFVK
jgi:hypothetical protein